MTHAPHPKPLPCPNPECGMPCELISTIDDYYVKCTEKYCYIGPHGNTREAALRKHNALCAASGIPTEELEKLRDEIGAAQLPLNPVHWYNRLDALISRVTEGKKDE